jgi:hypothetical protein
MSKRTPKPSSKPTEKKVPGGLSTTRTRGKQAPRPDTKALAIDDLPFKWDGQSVDHTVQGDWTWDLAPKHVSDLLSLLSSLSGLKWREVKEQVTSSKSGTHRLHHDQQVDSLCKEAKQRLDEIGHGDVERLFRLRHGNLPRVWGFIRQGVFVILWYDSEHKVYPTEAG